MPKRKNKKVIGLMKDKLGGEKNLLDWEQKLIVFVSKDDGSEEKKAKGT